MFYSELLTSSLVVKSSTPPISFSLSATKRMSNIIIHIMFIHLLLKRYFPLQNIALPLLLNLPRAAALHSPEADRSCMQCCRHSQVVRDMQLQSRARHCTAGHCSAADQSLQTQQKCDGLSSFPGKLQNSGGLRGKHRVSVSLLLGRSAVGCEG